MTKWVITCEHGGNKVPPQYQALFRGHEEVLATHRAIDKGSEIVFNLLKARADYSRINQITRLLVELNRSLHHPKLFSEFSNILSKEEKGEVIEKYYHPYRNEVESKISNFLHDGHKVVHLSVHTFTPTFNGHTRSNDIGFLYDPGRKEEKQFCFQWKKNLRINLPHMKIRFNYPYLGKADGFTTYLRTKFVKNYLGIEVEINQKHNSESLKKIAAALENARPVF